MNHDTLENLEVGMLRPYARSERFEEIHIRYVRREQEHVFLRLNINAHESFREAIDRELNRRRHDMVQLVFPDNVPAVDDADSQEAVADSSAVPNARPIHYTIFDVDTPNGDPPTNEHPEAPLTLSLIHI